MLVTIDPYYDIEFYKECIQALHNNNVEFKEYISTKPPYEFYFEVEQSPTFINFDKVPDSYSKWLVNITKALKPSDDYIYARRESFTNQKAIQHYAINDALQAPQKSGEVVFFTATKESVMRLSRDYHRKIYFMGKYYNNKYKVFMTDSLMVKNFLHPEQILVESNSFKHITETEVQLNFKIFREKDRLEKLSETPYVLKGTYYPVSVRPELSGRFNIS